MRIKLFHLCCMSFFTCLAVQPVEAAYTIKNGWFAHVDNAATNSLQEHYNAGMKALEERDWKDAARQFNIASVNFPNSPLGSDASYYLGVAYYHLDELDFANEAFSKYLHTRNNPQFFQEAIEYKFAIADQFLYGAKRRFFGTKQLPKWACGKEMAIMIYDEVIAALPCHDLSARSLFAKGHLLWEMKEYRESIEVFDLLTKRFPKHELAPESYVLITKIYLDQSRWEFQNPDLLALAQINLRHFKRDFPREERLCIAEADVLRIAEIYAQGLYDTGQFYERVKQPRASVIYYENAIKQFPDTAVAQVCRQRLAQLRCNLFRPVAGESATVVPVECNGLKTAS